MELIIKIALAILRLLIPALIEQTRDTAEVGCRRPKLREALNKRIKSAREAARIRREET